MIGQILAVIIFIAMFIMIVLDKSDRYIPAIIGAALVIIVVFLICMRSVDAITQTLNLNSIFHIGFWYNSTGTAETVAGVNWTTIIFIAGMMIMVEGMGESGFFRWLCLLIAKTVRYKIAPIFIIFAIMSAVLSMFIDSITVLLFLAIVTIELSRVLKFDPIPMIITEIFCANLGGAATLCGDPPNIIIGTSLGLTFFDFMQNTGLIVFISMAVIIPFLYLCFRKSLNTKEAETANKQPSSLLATYPSNLKESVINYKLVGIFHNIKQGFSKRLKKESESVKDKISELVPRNAITNIVQFIISITIFLITVMLLITHASTGISVASIGVIAALLTLITSRCGALKLIKKFDWKTIVFFIGLFIVVGGLEQTHVLEMMASIIGKMCNGNLIFAIIIILWLSAIASAFVDNIPFAATMVPVIKKLALTQGFDLNILAWTLALGTDIGGNGTPIGASANVVGTAIASKEGYNISWGKFCKYAAPASAITLLMCMIYLIIRYV